MTIYIGLLRGINVGGHKKLKMASLKQHLSDDGLEDVTTYIQSGNLIFQSRKKEAALESLIAKCILTHFGFNVPVLVRSLAFIESLFEHNPFHDCDLKTVAATILSDAPNKKSRESLQARDFSPDRLKILTDVAYLHCPNGSIKSKLTISLMEKQFGVQATNRNWNTITKLVALGRAMQDA